MAESLAQAVAALRGPDVHIVGQNTLGGGDISSAWRLHLSDGSTLFAKSNRRQFLPMFTAEAAGLEALRRPGLLGVPRPLMAGTEGQESFLLMEYLESRPPIPSYWEVFGRQLALLHRADCSAWTEPGKPFGFHQDNFIGSTPQCNTPHASWVPFFRDCRLEPQIRLARPHMDAHLRRACDHLLERLDTLLPEPEFPSLLHGDLWGGNVLTGPDGRAWILDPAVYVGHFEAELAMTELFGGFSPAFYQAYREITPVDPEFPGRRPLYNLYHLLNHFNLFGGSYLSSVRTIVFRFAD